MSDQLDNITPFQLPSPPPQESTETFGERLRRRRSEIHSSGKSTREEGAWLRHGEAWAALVVESPHASASIMGKSRAIALAIEGVETVLFAEDIPPFQNSLGHEFSGEPLLAEDKVFYVGQPVAVVVARNLRLCRLAAEKLEIEYLPTPGILTLDHAVAVAGFHGKSRECERGDAVAALREAKRQIEGSFTIKPQQSCLDDMVEITVTPSANARHFNVKSRSLMPTSVRSAVAKAADVPESDVTLEVAPLKGASSAQELEPVRLARLATHAALKCASAVKLSVDPAVSHLVQGVRHETQVEYQVGFSPDGSIVAVDLRLYLDGGYFPADAYTVLDRALLHADGVYAIPHLRIISRLCQTNTLTSSSLPAEGAAQGCWAMEEIIRRVSDALNLPAHQVREKNFFVEGADLRTTPYGMPVSASAVQRVWKQALSRSDYLARKSVIAGWNRGNPSYKRGIAVTPIRFGVGDPRSERNAASVILQILPDGSVILRAGLADLDDGLDKQIREEVSRLLGVSASTVQVKLNDFEALPQATPMLGTDAAGLALRATEEACQRLLKRLREVALQLFAARGQTEIQLESIHFAKDLVGADMSPQSPLHFKEVIEGAWKKRVNLVECGYHRTPNLWWDPELGAGWPFSAFTYAVAVTEVQVDAFTGEVQILKVDIAHEGSPSTHQNERDFAQLMRAFTLGTGWLLSEPSAEEGGPAAATQGIQGFSDALLQVNVDRLRPLGDLTKLPGDPCGEAPVLLAFSVREALADALRGFGLQPGLSVNLPLPATPPRVISACREIILARQAMPSPAPAEASSPSRPPVPPLPPTIATPSADK